MVAGSGATPVAATPTAALLVVPNGTQRPAALATALARHHPDWRLFATWSGDPQLHPVVNDDDPFTWLDDAVDAARERDLVRIPPHTLAWLDGLRGADRLLDQHGQVVVLAVGAVAVLGPLDPLIGCGGDLVLVPRTLGVLPDDGLRPDETDLVAEGRASASAWVARPGSATARAWLAARLRDTSADVPPARWVERMAAAFEVDWCDDPRVGVGAWRWSDEAVLLDVPGFDHRRPWVLDPRLPGAGRVSIVAPAARRLVVESAAPQLAGSIQPLRLPGGIAVDDAVRRIARVEPDAPAPWSEHRAFREMLSQRTWEDQRARRADLVAAFPDPAGADRAAFARWQRRAFVDDDVDLLLAPRPPARAAIRYGSSDAPDPRGVDLIGYLDRELSLGDVARRILTGLRDAGVSVSTCGFDRTDSPRVAGPLLDQRLSHRTSLAVVNADQFPALAVDHPEVFAGGRRTIGYWFWELEAVPKAMRASFALVDEIWAGSSFVADAFRAVAPVPVRHVPVPVPEPVSSGAERSSFAALRDLGDRFVFLVVFDHFSVTERKNPEGAIEAFRRAFPVDGEGPVLVVKTMNGDRRWASHQRVLHAAGGRGDVRVWDAHLDRGDQMALVAAADCLVSLHRSEGLGLHLAEAMWLGTPVVATRYSGNLDLMDDDSAVLVDAGRVHVVDGEGVYPTSAVWADPDLDAAAAAMRSLASDPARGRALAAAGRARMAAQPSLADVGRTIDRLVSGAEGA